MVHSVVHSPLLYVTWSGSETWPSLSLLTCEMKRCMKPRARGRSSNTSLASQLCSSHGCVVTVPAIPSPPGHPTHSLLAPPSSLPSAKLSSRDYHQLCAHLSQRTPVPIILGTQEPFHTPHPRAGRSSTCPQRSAVSSSASWATMLLKACPQLRGWPHRDGLEMSQITLGQVRPLLLVPDTHTKSLAHVHKGKPHWILTQVQGKPPAALFIYPKWQVWQNRQISEEEFKSAWAATPWGQEQKTHSPRIDSAQVSAPIRTKRIRKT